MSHINKKCKVYMLDVKSLIKYKPKIASNYSLEEK